MPTLAEGCPQFVARYPKAVHVVPLHLIRSVWAERALLSKAELTRRRTHSGRPTTAAVDLRLGFGEFVHFYLPISSPPWRELPILEAQLRSSTIPPFPHIALEIPTGSFDLDGCIISNWNIAVSRPGVSGGQMGGNWTRGTSPDSIARGWTTFREWLSTSDLSSEKKIRRARGFWHEGFLVPVLRGNEIATQFRSIGRGGTKPEFLYRSPLTLPAGARIVAFSPDDFDTLRRLGIPGKTLTLETFPGYHGTLVEPAVRRAINAYTSDAPISPELDFDRIRPSLE